MTDVIFKCSFGEIEKLTHNNYAQWSSEIETFLYIENAMTIVLGEEVAPIEGASAASIRKFERYTNRYNKAYRLIMASCSDLVKIYLRGMCDPALMWITLKDKLSMAASKAARQVLARHFLALRPLDSDPTIHVYITKLMQIMDQLVGTSEEISNTKLVDQLLTYLPAKFSEIQYILKLSGIDDINAVIAKLQEHENTKNLQAEILDMNTSLTSGSAPQASFNRGRGSYRGRGRPYRGGYRGRGRGRGGYQGGFAAGTPATPAAGGPAGGSAPPATGTQQGSPYRRVSRQTECWNCGKFGHIKAYCRSNPKPASTPQA